MYIRPFLNSLSYEHNEAQVWQLLCKAITKSLQSQRKQTDQPQDSSTLTGWF